MENHVTFENQIYFKNDTDFKKFVYNNICQCLDQCLDLNEKELIIQNNSTICNEIKLGKQTMSNENVHQYYDSIITNAIDFFVDNSIIINDEYKYYIINNGIKLKLTWDNIKLINNDNDKTLLWLFRKLIVDLLLKKLLLFYNDIKIYSVGSTTITSDYDITIYSNGNGNVNIANFINDFQELFVFLFNDTSDIVFDTNIYGKSFIVFNPNENYTYKICDKIKTPFYYLKFSESYKYSQLTWALVKYFKNIKESFDEYISNDYINFLIKNIWTKPLNIISIAKNTLLSLLNKDLKVINYNILLENEDNIKNVYKNTDQLIIESDYISMTNFYGNETYFTKGAFLDIVINTQMCKDQDKIEISEIDLLCSILENAGFYFIHSNKTKYLKRVVSTLNNLISINTEFYKVLTDNKYYKDFNIIIESLKTNNSLDDNKYCMWVDQAQEEFDLLKCEKYKLFNLLFHIIYILLKKHLNSVKNITKDNVPFYNYFINKEFNNFNLNVDFLQPFSRESSVDTSNNLLNSDKFLNSDSNSNLDKDFRKSLSKIREDNFNLTNKNSLENFPLNRLKRMSYVKLD